MSHRRVNKEEKRREVALKCSDLIYEVGMKNITVSQVAKTAGIGKGTVYEYFENKDDIIFEIINIYIENYHNQFIESIQNVKTTKQKVLHFFKFALDDSEENMRHFNGYKEYLSILFSNDNQNMKEFNCKTHDFFKEQLKKIITDGIEKGELKEIALDLSDGLLTYEKGLVILKMSQKEFDANENFEQFINAIFELIEVKDV